MNSKIVDRPKRSVNLTEAQLQWLKNQVITAPSITQAAINLGISNDTLSRTIAFGSCSEKTYNTLFPGDGEQCDSKDSNGHFKNSHFKQGPDYVRV